MEEILNDVDVSHLDGAFLWREAAECMAVSLAPPVGGSESMRCRNLTAKGLEGTPVCGAALAGSLHQPLTSGGSVR